MYEDTYCEISKSSILNEKWETSNVYPIKNIYFKYFVINVAINWRIFGLYLLLSFNLL